MAPGRVRVWRVLVVGDDEEEDIVRVYRRCGDEEYEVVEIGI